MENIFRQIQYPFSFDFCPFLEEADKNILEWIKSFDLLPTEDAVQRYQRENYVRWAARTFPFADKSGFLLAASWSALFFIVDDIIAAAGSTKVAHTLNSIKQGAIDVLIHDKSIERGTDSNFAACFSDLWQRMKKHTDQEWQQWFVEESIKMFKAWEMELALQMPDKKMDLETYIKMRPYFSGGHMVVCLLSLATKHNFPTYIYKHDTIQQLQLMAIRMASWANDIHSLGKELTKEGTGNLVSLFMEEKQLSLREALDETIKLHNSDLAKFLTLEASLPSFGLEIDPEVKKYVRALKAVVSGSHEWAVNETDRYHETELLLENIT